MNDDYIDRALIKLERQYGKDELVISLNRKIKEKDFKIGQLESEIDHLTHCLNSKKHNREINKNAKVELRKNALFNKNVEDLRKANQEIKKLKYQVNNWMSKYFTLEKEINK